ncbi:4'-phosphopantetheinyl transferase family protein [Hydrogenophaga crocea]|uniref:4'-phosphopantetheinyl transferase superfamily protein n=1 Tax=Hydrogenophaga crocea TaxID=2716225 RepID=A0A6G8IFP2_9BURK|nr:4'-phosphopantetheinyl transferase superfamily protein [Hydrogenophaga crocea]QIM51878.1 4'-phosphopantetheinyl transferase superfamily protein [Hydrogenophaga crocea]
MPRIALVLNHPVRLQAWLFHHPRATEGAPADDPWLSPAERARVLRLRFQRDRVRYVHRRRALRAVLGERLGLPGPAVPLRLGLHDKPELDTAALAAPAPHFNMSHHEDHSLVVLCDEAEVGVDIEGERGWPDIDALAAMNFTPAEIAGYQALQGVQRESAFLRVWTRKEACLKAVGTGLAIDLKALHAGLETDTREVPVPTDAGTLPVLLSSHTAPGGLLVAVATRC